VTDKGYHSGAVVNRMKTYEVRSYIPEKKQKGRRNWVGKAAEQQAVYANRRRVRGEYGKSLLRRRGEFVERSFAHCYETGAMRRCHLRGRDNILKRQLVHVGAFNLSLILRQLLGAGTPRELRNRFARFVVSVLLLFSNRNSQQRLRCRGISGSVAKCVEPKIMEVLVCLAEHTGEVVPKEKLLQAVWPDTFVCDDVLKRSVSELRHVFGDDAHESRLIETIPKRGYRLVVDVKPANGKTPAHLATAQAIEEELPQVRPINRQWRVGLLALGIAGLVGGFLLAFNVGIR